MAECADCIHYNVCREESQSVLDDRRRESKECT